MLKMLQRRPDQAPVLSQTAVVVIAHISGFPPGDYTQQVFQHSLQYVIEKYGSHLTQPADGCLMAVFNVPNPVPVPGYLAMMAALEMHQVFHALQREMRRPEVMLRIGIDRGLVTLGSTNSTPEVHGEVTESAHFLADYAQPGELALTVAIHDEIGLLAQNATLIAADDVVIPALGRATRIYRLTLPETPLTTTRSLSAVVEIEQGAQVLVAEDDPSLRSLFAKVLKNAGFSVRIATNGAEVIQYLENGLPHLLVVDLGLPGVSGEQVIRYAREQQGERPITIVVVTGNHLAAQTVIGELADLVLIKPVSPRDLVDFVRRFIQRQ